MPQESQIYVATETFSAELDGSPQMVYKGITRVRAGHPLLKGRESLFAPINLDVDYDVEQATAEPGVKRGAEDRPRQPEVKTRLVAEEKK